MKPAVLPAWRGLPGLRKVHLSIQTSQAEDGLCFAQISPLEERRMDARISDVPCCRSGLQAVEAAR